MKSKMIVPALLAAAILAACSGNRVTETQNIKELVHDYSLGNIENQSASITSTQLIVTDSDKRKSVYALPDEEFFVSIAPYVNETHPCTNHSLTGCQGEMVEEEFNVYIEDTEGNVILEETMKSQKNGFIDLWLPRNKKYRTVITQSDKKVEAEFSTFEGDGTCITTMQLKYS
jgi:hypothetical protein